ncbi:MAG: hypothetical protein IJW63_07465 [Lachnospiraceae bacterium]|nr:hypothetical protein [Lachnospiraceae bacterium]
MFYHQISTESARLSKEISRLEAEIQTYPSGKLICSKNGKYTKWYQSDGVTKKYIPKAECSLVTQLATKEYLLCLLSDYVHHKQFLDSYLQKCEKYVNNVDTLLTSKPSYYSLISSPFLVNSQSLHDKCLDWLNTPFTPNAAHPENLVHQSISGHLLRSKSEAMIDGLLHLSKIPFKYEAPLILGGTTLYPDFTICHPLTGKLFYWEHFGLMDDPLYRKKTHSKLNLYISHDILPGVQLITTYEDNSSPLTMHKIREIIAQHFM